MGSSGNQIVETGLWQSGEIMAPKKNRMGILKRQREQRKAEKKELKKIRRKKMREQAAAEKDGSLVPTDQDQDQDQVAEADETSDISSDEPA